MFCIKWTVPQRVQKQKLQFTSDCSNRFVWWTVIKLHLVIIFFITLFTDATTMEYPEVAHDTRVMSFSLSSCIGMLGGTGYDFGTSQVCYFSSSDTDLCKVSVYVQCIIL